MPKYLYNGVELPALPDWDKTVFPYAYIWTIALFPGDTPSIYKLTIHQTPLLYGTVNGSQSIYINAGTTAIYNCKLTDGEFKTWEYFGETGVSETTTVDPIWVNHNVYSDTDGTLYLAASEPVPVVLKVSPQIAFTIGKQLGRRIFR